MRINIDSSSDDTCDTVSAYCATRMQMHHLVLLHLPVFQYCRVSPLYSLGGKNERLLVVFKIPIDDFLPR